MEDNTDTMYFTEIDHLGSIIGLLGTDETVREEYSYDPWESTYSEKLIALSFPARNRMYNETYGRVNR